MLQSFDFKRKPLRNYSVFLPFSLRTDKEGVVNKICYTGNRDNYLDVPLDRVLPLYRAMKAYFDLLYDPKYHITYKLEQGKVLSTGV